jgi:type IX secretion system PorP/SprF family membrane protein
MKKINKKYIVFVLMLLTFDIAFAQQDPQFTHYMYNMNTINPAYATQTKGVVNVGGFYRTQWVGVIGAPKSASLFVHTPITTKIEMGLSFVNDAIGDVVKENNIYLDFAYVLPLSEKNKLSFGLKGGVTLFETNFNGFQYTDIQQDLAFENNINKSFPNVGVGTYFFSNHYYIGFSAPNLLTTKHLDVKNGIKTTGVEAVHYFLTGGYVFDITQTYKFKPAFMVKGVSGAPLSIDLTSNILINNRFELGLGYRFDDSVSALTTIYLTPKLKIGYSYDHTLSNLGRFNSGSHEVFLLFDIGNSNKSTNSGYDKSPRFF